MSDGKSSGMSGDMNGGKKRLIGVGVGVGPDDPELVTVKGINVLRSADVIVVVPDERTAVLRPPTLVIGVGASSGALAEEIWQLIDETLADAGLSPRSVGALATVEAKADEPGILAVAERLGVPLVTYDAERLGAIEVPNPSAVPLAAVGTPSVAEAAALACAGAGAELLVPKRKSAPPSGPARATAAVARRCPRGRLAVVGLRPGARDLRMNYDSCIYRVTLPGFEDHVGLPQQPHHHPEDLAHRHNHHHGAHVHTH
ncbi:MAG: cobalamin biosynthesis protein [Streptomycetaceae bacterium]|nr:cobalamin biosynthesis protein [Streptomycetaceae bacterium]